MHECTLVRFDCCAGYFGEMDTLAMTTAMWECGALVSCTFADKQGKKIGNGTSDISVGWKFASPGPGYVHTEQWSGQKWMALQELMDGLLGLGRFPKHDGRQEA